MRILYLLFAVLVFLFQGVADLGPPLADTMACRDQGGFCQLMSCPQVFSVSGTCHGGLLKCCTR
uniref:Beta-defensin-like domain-containing protein n=1 Tax=Gopherus evgoodei TaxID=1825980 RepID=A0A8C4Y100_9SAUR